MNAGVSLNNIPTTKAVNSIMKSGQVISVNNSAAFLKKMMSFYENSNKTVPSSTSEEADKLNIMDLVTGSNIFNFADINNMNIESNKEIKSLNEAKVDEDTDLSRTIDNFIIMMNYFNPVNENVTLEKSSLESNLLRESESQSLLNLKINNHLKLDNTLHMTEKTEASKLIKNEGIQQEGVHVEEMIVDIDRNKDKAADKVNFSAELLASNEPIVQGESKVVILTDESSQLKSQVLSQVKDKIIFMAEEGSSSGRIKQVTMELQPHNLGKVNVKMIFEDNKVTVEITALKEETQKILSSNAGELAKTLNKNMDSSINVVVKNHESHESHPLNYYQDNSQTYNEEYGQHKGNRQQRSYYYSGDNKDSDEESLFSELINLRNIKLHQ